MAGESLVSQYLRIEIEETLYIGRGKYSRPSAIKGQGHYEGSWYVGSKAMTGGWTKYGGARQPVFQEAVKDEWICQSCSDKQPKALTPYLFEYPEGEHIRVCAVCLANDCRSLFERIKIEF